MKLEEIKALATQIIEQGWANGDQADDIKMEMFSQKIPYSKLNGLFKSISIELGLMVDPKTVTDGANALIEQVAWDEYEGWEQFAAAITKIAENVDGATDARVLTLVRSFCRDEEIEVPKKPRAGGGGGGRGGKLSEAVVALVNSNPHATKQDAYDALKGLVGGNNKHVNTMYYVNSFFAMCLAVANGTSVKEASASLSTQPDPVDNFEPAPEVELDEEDDMD